MQCNSKSANRLNGAGSHNCKLWTDGASVDCAFGQEGAAKDAGSGGLCSARRAARGNRSRKLLDAAIRGFGNSVGHRRLPVARTIQHRRGRRAKQVRNQHDGYRLGESEASGGRAGRRKAVAFGNEQPVGTVQRCVPSRGRQFAGNPNLRRILEESICFGCGSNRSRTRKRRAW